MRPHLFIVGQSGGSNVAASLYRAAEAELPKGTVAFWDISASNRGSRLLRALTWRLGDRRPIRQRSFVNALVEAGRTERPEYLIATGPALTEASLIALRATGTTCLNFSTDDPWNSVVRSKWHLRALRQYDVVATPRDNVGDFIAIGCRRVDTIPFGYDELLVANEGQTRDGPDVLFVGGADGDRAAFIAQVAAKVPVSVVGGYWSRQRISGVIDLGQQSPAAVASLTTAARVNLCLVRRANRDGHVMRTYEMAAIGAAMVVEDTADHRALFGPEGEAVMYFQTPAEATAKVEMLLADEPLRFRLKARAQRLVVDGGNTYRDRLRTMLDILLEAKAYRSPDAR